MYIGIVTGLKTNVQYVTMPCETRDQARRAAIKLSEFYGNSINFKIQTKSIQSAK